MMVTFHKVRCNLYLCGGGLSFARAIHTKKPRERNLNPKDIVYKWLVLGRRPTIYTRSLWVHVLVGVLSLGILSCVVRARHKNKQTPRITILMSWYDTSTSLNQCWHKVIQGRGGRRAEPGQNSLLPWITYVNIKFVTRGCGAGWRSPGLACLPHIH